MKYIFFSILIFAGFSAGFVSCDNGAYTATPGTVNNSPNPIYEPPASNSGSFTAKINGTTFTGTTNYYYDTTEAGIPILDIFGEIIPSNPLNTQSISINLSNYNGGGQNGVGTYNFNVSTAGIQASAGYFNGTSDIELADSGTIVVTSIDNNKISGTFHFVTDSGTNITNGVFTNLPKL